MTATEPKAMSDADVQTLIARVDWKSGSIVPALLATITALRAELEAVKANQRTPGTVEVCKRCRLPVSNYGCPAMNDTAAKIACPLQQKDPAP